MICPRFRGVEARVFVPVAKEVRVGLERVYIGPGRVVLLELADVEDVVHVCASGGLRQVQLKDIARGLFEDHKGVREEWQTASRRRASVS